MKTCVLYIVTPYSLYSELTMQLREPVKQRRILCCSGKHKCKDTLPHTTAVLAAIIVPWHWILVTGCQWVRPLCLLLIPDPHVSASIPLLDRSAVAPEPSVDGDLQKGARDKVRPPYFGVWWITVSSRLFYLKNHDDIQIWSILLMLII